MTGFKEILYEFNLDILNILCKRIANVKVSSRKEILKLSVLKLKTQHCQPDWITMKTYK